MKQDHIEEVLSVLIQNIDNIAIVLQQTLPPVLADDLQNAMTHRDDQLEDIYHKYKELEEREEEHAQEIYNDVMQPRS